MLPMQYSTRVVHPQGVDSRTDIERILDAIARESPILNLPEQHADYWSIYREGLSERDLEMLNSYRTKFNLTKV